MKNLFFRYVIIASAFLLPGGSTLADTHRSVNSCISAAAIDDGTIQKLKARYKTSRVVSKFHYNLKYFEVSVTYKDGTDVTFLCNASGEELLKMPSGTECKVFIRGDILHFHTSQIMVNTDCHVVHDFTGTFKHILDADAKWTCVSDYGSLDKNRACLLNTKGNAVIPTGLYESIRIRKTDSGLKYIIVYGRDMKQQGLYDYNGNKLLDAQYKLITVARDGLVRSYSDVVGEKAIVHDVRVSQAVSAPSGSTGSTTKTAAVKTVAAATAQGDDRQIRTLQTTVQVTEKGTSTSGSSNGSVSKVQQASDSELSDTEKALQKQAEFNRETNDLISRMDEQIAWARILGDTEELIRKDKLIPAARHLNSSLKNFSSQDSELLKNIAEYVDKIKKSVNKYSWSVAGNGNMYNAPIVLAELTNLANLEMELNTLQVQFAIQASQLGNTSAQRMLDMWNTQPQTASPSYGGQNGGGYQGGGYQNGNNNEYRKKQLLDNIATYEKRIREAEKWTNTGSVTDYGYISIISDYRRMIEDAKRELRSMGYNVY